MRKILIPIFGLSALFVTLTSCSVVTKYVYGEEYTFIKTKSGLIVSAYKDNEPEDVIIPEECQGYKVVGLNGNLYSSSKLKGVESLKSIVIPNTVKTIGDFCFTNCKNLNSVNIPTSLTKIGYQVFAGTAITSADIPEGVERIERYAFANCKSLEYVIMPKSVEFVDYGILRYDDALTDIYYTGSEDDYSKIRFRDKLIKEDGENKTYFDSYVRYYSESTPTGANSYWHYVDGKPTKW